MAPQNDPHHWCHQDPWRCPSQNLHGQGTGTGVTTWGEMTEDDQFNGAFKRAENPFHVYFFIIFIGLLAACIVGFCWRFYVMFRTMCIKQHQLHHRFVESPPSPTDSSNNVQTNSRHFYQRHHDNSSEHSVTPPPSNFNDIASWTLPMPNLAGHRIFDGAAAAAAAQHQQHQSIPVNPQFITWNVNARTGAPAPDYNSSMVDQPPPSYAEALLIGQNERRS